jgi:hypothetical protein
LHSGKDSNQAKDFDIQAELKSFHRQFPRKFVRTSSDDNDHDGSDSDDDNWEEWERMQVLNRIVRLWSSIWGGLICWPMRLEDMFREVFSGGDDVIMEWSIQVWEHADVGRTLLDEVEHWTGRLPVQDPRAMKILWKEFQGMHYLLIQGITIIETRVSVLNPGIFSVRPPNDRNLAIS